MSLSKKAVQEFIEIYQKENGVLLNKETAETMSERFLNVYKTIYGSVYNEHQLGDADARKRESQ